MCYTGEQWDEYDECLERYDDREQGNDDEELQLLMEKELEALATVSQANRTWIQARQAVKDVRATRQPMPGTYAAALARESQRRCFLCRGVHSARDRPDRKKPSGKVRRDPETTRRARNGLAKAKNSEQ